MLAFHFPFPPKAKKTLNLINQLYFHALNQPEDNDNRVSIVHSNVNVSSETQITSSISNSTSTNDLDTSKKSISKVTSPVKLAASRRAKRSTDIVFIDLTSDNVTEKVIKQKKAQRKLSWLEKAKKSLMAKTSTKKTDSTPEDSSRTRQQLEDSVNLDSLRIESPQHHLEDSDMEMIISEEKSGQKAASTTLQDSLKPEVSVVSTSEEVESVATSLVCNSEEVPRLEELNQPAMGEVVKNLSEEKVTEVEEVEESSCEISSTGGEVERGASETVNSTGRDECLEARGKTNERRASGGQEAPSVREIESRKTQPSKLEKCGALESTELTIKAEHVCEESHEIMKEEVVAVTNEAEEAQVVGPPSAPDTSNAKEAGEPEVCSTELRENEFQDGIDGLSLLASVSQSVSHLKISNQTAKSQVTNGELIKVRNYASLTNTSEDSAPRDDSPSFCNLEPEVINRIVGIYPEDAMDKVAYQVEVTSTEETDSYEIEPINGLNSFPSSNEDSCRGVQATQSNLVSVENPPQQPDKDDTKVILNGETVVLFQKSPNSNLYIINKAVKNRDRDSEEVQNGMRDLADHSSDAPGFPYDYSYENVYRNQPRLPYDLSQYGRDSVQARRGKKVAGLGDSASEDTKVSELLELAKPGKNLGLSMEVIGKGASGKRKSSSSAAMSRRRRIKQEFNGCGEIPNLITPNYSIQDRSQERTDPGRPAIHIPVTHSSPLSSIYTTYTGGAELYLPCHKNCTSMSCAVAVNPKGSTGVKARCSCLNCAYGIVTHCGECILPTSEARPNPIDQGKYYLPIHSTVQTSAVQERGGKDPLVKIFDQQLVCKLEQNLMDSKQHLENTVAVKCEPKEIYRAELDNKLPLKKRFKAIMSVPFDEMSIKREKAQSYPSTPMLSIAALDSRDALRTERSEGSTGSNNSGDQTMQETLHHSSEMIRRDYHKRMMMSASNGYRNHNGGAPNGTGSGGERKRKRRSAPRDGVPCGAEENNHEGSYQKVCKTPTKLKDPSTGCPMAAAKRPNATLKPQPRPSEKVNKEPSEPTSPVKMSARQTRSSKRNVPKVNYIYADADSDWNPAGGAKRKRKKTSR